MVGRFGESHPVGARVAPCLSTPPWAVDKARHNRRAALGFMAWNGGASPLCRPGKAVMEPIEFDATVYKVQTLVDNGLRITLDLPEQAIEQAALLMALKREGVAIKVIVVPDSR